MSDKEEMPLTEMDTASYDSTTQLLKAAVPYVYPPAGRMMAVIAKAIELQHVMKYLDHGDVSACEVQRRSVPPEEIIRDLRKYCGTREKEQLDKCLNLMNMLKMYDVYRNISSSADMSAVSQAMASMGNEAAGHPTGDSDDNDYLKKMQSMLTPEQIQLIRNISHQQNT